MDLIDLSSIFQDRSVTSSIPDYFQIRLPGSFSHRVHIFNHFHRPRGEGAGEKTLDCTVFVCMPRDFDKFKLRVVLSTMSHYIMFRLNYYICNNYVILYAFSS